MECKGEWLWHSIWKSQGINRNIMECKVVFASSAYPHDCVLIETLWNVKVIKLVGEDGSKIPY